MKGSTLVEGEISSVRIKSKQLCRQRLKLKSRTENVAHRPCGDARPGPSGRAYYGSTCPIKSLGSITVPEARQIVVTPFDPSNINAVKAVEAANLGVRPMGGWFAFRFLRLMKISESKLRSGAGEKSKVAMREVRRKFNELVRKRDGAIPEDQMKKYEKHIQEQTDKYCSGNRRCLRRERKEIMTI